MFVGYLGVSMGDRNIDPSVGFSLVEAFDKSRSMSMPSSNYPPTLYRVEHLSTIAIVG